MIRRLQNNSSKDRHYDAIVIGSGMGGLTTASLLASVSKKRVLVLESHFKHGGFLHSFRRKKFVWDPGVHYIGEMQEGSLTRKCMDLVTGGTVGWRRINSPFERFLFPGESFDVPDGAKEYQQSLIARFPAEEKNIRRYFKDVKAVQNWTHRNFFSKQFSERIGSVISIGKKLAYTNTQSYIENRFQDPLLRAIATAQWPDYGTPPSHSAFGVHAAVAADFLNGGFYPIGGSQVIADGAVNVIESHGGKCLVNHPVEEILIKDNQAYGVRADRKGKSETFFAPIVISNAGARSTFTKLVPAEFGQPEREKLINVKNGTSAVILFLGLNDDPRKHGFEECNYWMYDGYNYDELLSNAQSQPPIVDGGFLSFGSLRNPGQEPHTAQIVCFSRESEWQEFASKPWLKRGTEYEQQKEERAEGMIEFFAQRYPKLRGLIEYQELSSPLTIKSFTGHHGGAIYGQECDVNRLSRDQWRIGTSVKNLYLTGSDVGLPGVNGALMAGVMAAGKLLGWLGMPRIMKKVFTQTAAKETTAEQTQR
ncbi:MAG: phytoene desaturase family protein [Mariniblastus sp.]